MNLIGYAGKIIRLTDERLAHIKEHPEMIMHTAKIDETLASPDIVIKSRTDEESRLYFRYYEGLSIGNKYLCIKEGYFKETESDQIMEKVDMEGNIIGFSILKVSSLKDHPIEVSLTGKK